MLIEFGRKDTAFLSKNLKIGRLFLNMNVKKLLCGMAGFRDFPLRQQVSCALTPKRMLLIFQVSEIFVLL